MPEIVCSHEGVECEYPCSCRCNECEESFDPKSCNVCGDSHEEDVHEMILEEEPEDFNL